MLFGPVTIEKLLAIFVAEYLAHVIRYGAIAGAVFSLFYVWKQRHLRAMKIQPGYPPASDIGREIRDSLASLAIFALIGVGVYLMFRAGWTSIYTRIDEQGWGYLAASIVLLIVAHDAYFYWTHRLMHWRPLFRLAHHRHHMSHNPTPWAAFAFHPVEAVIEAGMFPVLCLFIPFHPLAVLVWLLYMTVMNVLGHCGFEIFPRRFARFALLPWHNSSTHHNMHHRFAQSNYGLYFNLWDRLMGTNHPRYLQEFDRVKDRQRAAIHSAD